MVAWSLDHSTKASQSWNWLLLQLALYQYVENIAVDSELTSLVHDSRQRGCKKTGNCYWLMLYAVVPTE